MNEIKFDKRNYRKHDKKNKSLIKKALKSSGRVALSLSMQRAKLSEVTVFTNKPKS